MRPRPKLQPLLLLAGLVLLGALGPRRVAAQLAWESPPLVGPHAPSGLSVFVVDPAPGDRLGALAQWRTQGPSWSLGYRGALAQGPRDELEAFGGIDVSRTLADGIGQGNLRVVAWGGAGLGAGDDVTVSLPLGLVAGWTGLGDGTAFSPYAGAHLVVDLTSAEGDALSLDGVFDLGLDLRLVSGWVARFGASVGGRDAVAVGIRVPS
jgi:hypothetical protein